MVWGKDMNGYEIWVEDVSPSEFDDVAADIYAEEGYFGIYVDDRGRYYYCEDDNPKRPCDCFSCWEEINEWLKKREGENLEPDETDTHDIYRVTNGQRQDGTLTAHLIDDGSRSDITFVFDGETVTSRWGERWLIKKILKELEKLQYNVTEYEMLDSACSVRLMDIAKELYVDMTAPGFVSFVNWYKENVSRNLDDMMQDVKDKYLETKNYKNKYICFDNNDEESYFNLETGEKVDYKVIHEEWEVDYAEWEERRKINLL